MSAAVNRHCSGHRISTSSFAYNTAHAIGAPDAAAVASAVPPPRIIIVPTWALSLLFRAPAGERAIDDEDATALLEGAEAEGPTATRFTTTTRLGGG